MSISEAFKKYNTIETELLLEHVLNKSKEFLFMHPEKKLTEKQETKLKVLAKRRLKGEPMAYILSYKYFYGLKFKVTKDTLIPRPETEWLVEKALELLSLRAAPSVAIQDSKAVTTKNNGLPRSGVPDLAMTPIRILDMGTGSGCIAISIAHSLATRDLLLGTFSIHAADISPKALKIAKQNSRSLLSLPWRGEMPKAERSNAVKSTNQPPKIKFIHSNLFSHLPYTYDLIIANLPYVPVSDYNKLKASLKYEPKSAITDSTLKGDKLINNFLDKLQEHLNHRGLVMLEVDPSQVKNLSNVIKEKFKINSLEIIKDIQKLERFIIFSK